MNLWETPCPTCRGDKVLHYETPAYPDDPSIPWPCPDCQDESGTATGLKWPGLSKPCCAEEFIQHCYELGCDRCNGTGRVPKSEAEQAWHIITSCGAIHIEFDREVDEYGHEMWVARLVWFDSDSVSGYRDIISGPRDSQFAALEAALEASNANT